MNIYELDLYFRRLLNLEAFAAVDVSQNGLQVACSAKQIKKVAFAVDACLENFSKAAQVGADVLFVHHGLFWGKSLTVTKRHYKRLAALIKNDIALYAVHLPLDVHPVLGNNAGLAENLGLQNREPFGFYNGTALGVKGTIMSYRLPQPNEGVTLDELLARLFKNGEQPHIVLPFGKRELKHVGIISGAASNFIDEAVAENLDCFITGEVKHEVYHTALESSITVVGGGHYQTETVGVQLVREKFFADTKLETVFLHTPTNL